MQKEKENIHHCYLDKSVFGSLADFKSRIYVSQKIAMKYPSLDECKIMLFVAYQDVEICLSINQFVRLLYYIKIRVITLNNRE